jgi:hypothetical protein
MWRGSKSAVERKLALHLAGEDKVEQGAVVREVATSCNHRAIRN